MGPPIATDHPFDGLDDADDRRMLMCGIYQTDAGLETRAGYGDDLLRSQYAAQIGTGTRTGRLVEMAALEKGFSDVTN